MILEVKNIHKRYTIERGIFKRETGNIHALDDISFQVEEFKTLGIIGESGCGKTTLAKIILRLIPPSSGEIIFDKRRIASLRKDVQIIFQNPYNSLNPKMRVYELVSEPIIIHKLMSSRLAKDRVVRLLEMVGLEASVLKRLPIEFSGGQRQRICIARALACEPKFIVLDEPISSLDLTIQAQMLDLFLSIKKEFKLTYVFISHNLAVIKHIADSVIVMRNGRIVEQGDCGKIFQAPVNGYTKLLLAAARGIE